MFSNLFSFIFGCRHPERTWPRSAPGVPTYQACIKCGRELPYKRIVFGREASA